MELSITIVIALCAVVFVAGFIDSVAGGGGILTLPAYLFVGIPPQCALGTNKLVSFFGTTMAVYNFIRNKKIVLKIIFIGILFSVLGSIAGTKSILFFNQEVAGRIITILLPLGAAAFFIPAKVVTLGYEFTKVDYYIKTPVICFALGFYDGFFGPGAGTFLAILFFMFVRVDLIRSTGNAKVFNLSSNLGSLITFVAAGKVVYAIALPLVISSMLGNYIGSYFAIRRGAKFIRFFIAIVLIFIIFVMFAKYF